MNTRCASVLCVAMFLLVQSAKAADTDVNITVEKKRLEHTAGSGFQPNSDTSKKTDEWAFTVTVENQTFKALENLEVKYIIFYKTEKLGQKGPARKETKSGSYTIPSIASLDKAIFDTDSVKLTRGMLIGQPGSYEYFTNGAKPNAADTLTGIWIRIYKDGNQFAEYGYPAGLTSTEQWQDSN